LSSKPGTDPNAPGAAKASGNEEAKAAVAPKVYEEKLFKKPDYPVSAALKGTDPSRATYNDGNRNE